MKHFADDRDTDSITRLQHARPNRTRIVQQRAVASVVLGNQMSSYRVQCDLLKPVGTAERDGFNGGVKADGPPDATGYEKL
jgi:hypothetical protein